MVKENWKVWMRKYMHCPVCMRSWFEEGGEESTCECGEE